METINQEKLNYLIGENEVMASVITLVVILIEKNRKKTDIFYLYITERKIPITILMNNLVTFLRRINKKS
jgi:hypothetical protein